MTQLLGIIQLVIIIAILLYEYKFKSISIFLWATLLVMFGIMHFFTVFFDNFPYPDTVLNEASIFVIGFCLMYIFTRIILQRNKEATSINIKDIKILSKNDKRITNIFLVIILICVGYKLITLAQASGGLLNSSWATGRQMTANRDYLSFSQVATTLYFPSAGITFVLLGLKRYKSAFMVMIIIMLNIIFTRNRIEILPLVCCIIAMFIYNDKKLNWKKVIGLVLLGSLTIYIIYGLRVFRHYGTMINFIEQFNFSEFNTRIIEQILTGDGELGLRKDFYYFIYNENNFENFNKAHTYIRMLFVLIPTRWSFGLKPPDFAISMGSAINSYIPGFSTHPTLFGDCYANLGMYGILLGVIWAVFVFFADKIINRKNKIIQAILLITFATSYIIIGRGSVYNAFVWNVYGVILVGIIYMLNRVKLMKKGVR